MAETCLRPARGAAPTSPPTTARAAPTASSTAWWPRCSTSSGVRERTVGVAPVGCAVLAYNYFNWTSRRPPTAARRRWPPASSGRAPISSSSPTRATATWRRSAWREIVHCANRGEKITVVFVNNAIYGMTGGQMAPTTMPGQVATTCPLGRDVEQAGHPIRVAELLSTLRTPAFVARAAVHTPLAVGQRQGDAAPGLPLPGRRDAASRWSRCSPPARPTGACRRPRPPAGSRRT